MQVVYAIIKEQIEPLFFHSDLDRQTLPLPNFTEVMEARTVLVADLELRLMTLQGWGSKSKRTLATIASLQERIAELKPVKLYRVIHEEINETPDLVLCKGDLYCGGKFSIPSAYVGSTYFHTSQEAVENCITRMEEYLEERCRNIAVGEAQLEKLKELRK